MHRATPPPRLHWAPRDDPLVTHAGAVFRENRWRDCGGCVGIVRVLEGQEKTLQVFQGFNFSGAAGRNRTGDTRIFRSRVSGLP
jgi:hypothetical protein